MRSQSTLGTTSDFYGTLLIRVILGKLLQDIKIHMARDLHDTEWTIEDLWWVSGKSGHWQAQTRMWIILKYTLQLHNIYFIPIYSSIRFQILALILS